MATQRVHPDGPCRTSILSEWRATFRPCPRSRAHRAPPPPGTSLVGRLPLHGVQVPPRTPQEPPPSSTAGVLVSAGPHSPHAGSPSGTAEHCPAGRSDAIESMPRVAAPRAVPLSRAGVHARSISERCRRSPSPRPRPSHPACGPCRADRSRRRGQPAATLHHWLVAAEPSAAPSSSSSSFRSFLWSPTSAPVRLADGT